MAVLNFSGHEDKVSNLMVRDRGVEHVDADEGVADHEEDRANEHGPLSGHSGPPNLHVKPLQGRDNAK